MNEVPDLEKIAAVVVDTPFPEGWIWCVGGNGVGTENATGVQESDADALLKKSPFRDKDSLQALV